MYVNGPLTNSKKVITENSKNALIKSQKAGAILVLASGIPTSGLIDLARELKMDEADYPY